MYAQQIKMGGKLKALQFVFRWAINHVAVFFFLHCKEGTELAVEFELDVVALGCHELQYLGLIMFCHNGLKYLINYSTQCYLFIYLLFW